ncbi:hypothetical protein BDZ94DRAFT_1269235 [Collybia nuda]|uniref:F-box domain-containing protein n=1 Tax=Collybia nuda TaxID=64659 RepID=A0A9P5XYH0_9AGAR|nr:hypothetical protein BDZ94DRAFT_1269235 [Collybia nuda]
MNKISSITPLAHTSERNGEHATKPTISRSFIKNLPVEILGEIFVWCLNFQSNNLSLPSIYEAPMLLCRVCGHWRRIAMSMPILWAAFSAYLHADTENSQFISLINFWIKQSRPYHLSFELCASSPSQRRTFQQSFPLFLTEINRWHDVTLELTPISCEQFLSAPLERASCLEALTLYNMGCTSIQVHQIPATVNKFSQLRRLTIMQPLPLLNISWSQLTDIHLSTPLPIDECLQILNKCLNIMNCTLPRIRAPNAAVGEFTIVLPALLRLILRSACDISEILAHLTCPTLLHLSIDHNSWNNTQAPKTFNKFLIRSSCVLETFHYFDEHIAECDLIQYISAPALRPLKFLAIHGLGAGVKTLNLLKLNENRNAAIFMPSLETLKIDVTGVPDGFFMKTIASRLRFMGTCNTTRQVIGATLKNVDVWFRCQGHRTFEEGVVELCVEHGSDIKRAAELSTVHGVRISAHVNCDCWNIDY